MVLADRAPRLPELLPCPADSLLLAPGVWSAAVAQVDSRAPQAPPQNGVAAAETATSQHRKTDLAAAARSMAVVAVVLAERWAPPKLQTVRLEAAPVPRRMAVAAVEHRAVEMAPQVATLEPLS